MTKSVEQLTLNEARTIVAVIRERLYCREDGFLDPDNDVDGADFVEAVASVFDEYGLVPEALGSEEE